MPPKEIQKEPKKKLTYAEYTALMNSTSSRNDKSSLNREYPGFQKQRRLDSNNTSRRNIDKKRTPLQKATFQINKHLQYKRDFERRKRRRLDQTPHLPPPPPIPSPQGQLNNLMNSDLSFLQAPVLPPTFNGFSTRSTTPSIVTARVIQSPGSSSQKPTSNNNSSNNKTRARKP